MIVTVDMRHHTENMESKIPMQIHPIKEEINEELDCFKIDDLSNYIVHELDDFKVDLDVHRGEDFNIHKFEEFDVHKVEELEVHKVVDLDYHKNEEFEIHRVFEVETQKFNNSTNRTDTIDIRNIILDCEFIDAEITEINIKQEMISAEDEESSEHTSLMHRCFKCDIEFGNFSTFAQHQLLHASSKTLFCNDCIFACRKKQDLIDHIQQNHLEIVSKSKVIDRSCRKKCTICKNTFKNTKSLLNHSKQCVKKHKIKKKRCHITDSDDEIMYELNTKKKKKCVGNKNKQLKCNECSFVAFKQYSLNRHILTHSNLHPFGCTQCSYSCNTSYQLNAHIERKHSSKELQTKTKRKAEDAPTQKYVCETCGASFNQATNLNTHKSTHKRGNFFFCKECDYACRSRKAFKRHNDIHAGIDINKHFCDLCSYCSYDSRHVRRHQVVHTRGGPKRRTKKSHD